MIKTFKIGGIHPLSSKLTVNQPIVEVPLPKQAVFPLSQHIGGEAEPVVEKGDEVRVGQLIAKAKGWMSANIHSSVSGKVSKIDLVMTTAGYALPAIFIEVIGDVWEESIDKKENLNISCILTPEEMLDRIHQNGIVGLGGATFPTHVKLKPPVGKSPKLLIINAAECEPYLTCDHQLMLEKPKEIIYGVHLLMKAIHVTEAVIAIENNKKDAIELFKSMSNRYLGISVQVLKEKYPQGGERQLIEAVTGKRVPSGQLPIDIGVIVQNVATVHAAYEALMNKKPLLDRVITVTGKNMFKPQNLLVRIGTPFSHIVDFVGGVPIDTKKIVAGGPMMGRAISDLSIPVTKGSAGLVFLSSKEAKREKEENCIKCSHCIEVCPMGLEPYLLMSLTENKQWKKMQEEYLMDCIECGSCLYACPSNRPLLDYIRFAKKVVRENNIK